jgi:dUTP pyrophosphatase
MVELNDCVVNPDFIIDNEYVSDLVDRQVQKQPNGIDLTIQTIQTVPPGLAIDFSNEKRNVPEGKVIFDSDKDESIVLNKRHRILRWLNFPRPYIVRCRELIVVPPSMGAVVIHRSSVIRGGSFLTTSWFDSGYVGHGAGCLYATPGMKIYARARIAQIVFYRADPACLYNGKYQNEGMKPKS